MEVERDNLLAERDRLQAERDRLGLDLNLIGNALGGIAPAEVRPLAEERASLTTEAERLRAEVERLQGELQAIVDQRAAQEREYGERVQWAEADLPAARAEAERLAALLRDRDAELQAALAARDRLAMEKESAKVEAGRLRMTVYELEREKCDRSEHDRPEIDQLRAEIGRHLAEIDRLRAGQAQDPAPAAAGNGEGLRAADTRVESLQRELADSRRLQDEMRGILGAMGIRFQEI